MSNTALLVIDFINDICHPQGKIASCSEHITQQNAIANVNKATAYAREHNWLVVMVKVGFDENYLSQPKLSPMFGQADQYQALKLGEFGTEFVEQLERQSSDVVMVKPRVSPFYATPLEALLRANNIDEVVVSGVSTTWAIQAAVREAHDRDYRVTIIEDACAASNQDEHQQSIETLSRIAKVIKVQQLKAQ